ncbi:hypothetical protein NWFMUON74_61970 [Nocardia wallacei]|uniref:Uncharacterized protein n=1 Tax=Nocardia wallacei TaxID=480035 RepID=A0A7G1KT57_9NOCA|nr:hypothetical protein NWFMUON74_61970 [Nocardia wallacei]
MIRLHRRRERNHAREIIARVDAERARQQVQAEDARIADSGGWPNINPHAAPREPLTVDGAHETMQRHRGCTVGGCPRKSAAYQTLVDAGRLRPDSGRAGSYPTYQ